MKTIVAYFILALEDEKFSAPLFLEVLALLTVRSV